LVYDGEKPPYVPELSGLSDSRPELTTPSTVYGATKLDCEREVLSLQKGIVLRLSNMIGRPYVYRPSGKKFAQFLYESLVSKEYIGLRCDEYRSFVGVEDVSKILIRIAMMAITTSTDVNADQSDHKSSAQIYRKIYNVGGPTGLSRLQLATIFAGVCGTTIEVKEKTSSNDCDKVHSSAGAWVVFPQLNLDTVVSSGIANPRDVTMIMTDTEQTFGYSFSSMEEVLSESLSYFKNFFL
jgi:dTDP-4-dehydrorhamnose reductase